MNKYFKVMINTWNEVFSYRLNFVMWRVRNVLTLLPTYFIWLTILSNRKEIFGYDTATMLTYILGASFVGSLVLTSRSNAIGEEINSGDLSNYLMKPINYFTYYFWKDIGDKAMNVVFSIVEIVILVILLKPPIFIQFNIEIIALTVVSLGIAIMLFFIFNLLLGFVGFWSADIWAPRFLFSIILYFFAGSFFPLDILPKEIYQVFSLTPFPYMVFFPIKIYLGTLSFASILNGLLISLAWVAILFIFVKMVWNKGIKSYTAQGR